jgi:hypothetical protein
MYGRDERCTQFSHKSWQEEIISKTSPRENNIKTDLGDMGDKNIDW